MGSFVFVRPPAACGGDRSRVPCLTSQVPPPAVEALPPAAPLPHQDLLPVSTGGGCSFVLARLPAAGGGDCYYLLGGAVPENAEAAVGVRSFPTCRLECVDGAGHSIWYLSPTKDTCATPS